MELFFVILAAVLLAILAARWIWPVITFCVLMGILFIVMGLS